MIRNDFVSNSSSSSFIIIKSFFTEHFKITAQDFKDALIALGIERLGHIMCDPKNKEESKKFFKECDDILKSWWAQVHPDRDDGAVRGHQEERRALREQRVGSIRRVRRGQGLLLKDA